jgi:hypothetical protein
VSLGVNVDYDKSSKPVGGFSTETMDLDAKKLDAEGSVYLQSAIDDFRNKIGSCECSDALKEFGVK